jgi:hypothetical protein
MRTLLLIVVAPLLVCCGCTYEVGSCGIGGSTPPDSDDIEYFHDATAKKAVPESPLADPDHSQAAKGTAE